MKSFTVNLSEAQLDDICPDWRITEEEYLRKLVRQEVIARLRREFYEFTDGGACPF